MATAKSELLERLKELHHSGDEENAHREADELLLDYIDDEEIAKAWEDVPKWYA